MKTSAAKAAAPSRTHSARLKSCPDTKQSCPRLIIVQLRALFCLANLVYTGLHMVWFALGLCSIITRQVTSAFHNAGKHVFGPMRQVLACLIWFWMSFSVGHAAWAQDPEAEEHYANSVRLLNSGELSPAAQESALAIKLAPKWAEPHLLLGRIYAAQKQPLQAQEMFQEAIKLKPEFAEAYLALGLLHLQQKDHEKAVESLREAVHLRPEYALAHLSLGNAYVSAGKWEEASKEFQTTLDLSPQDKGLSFFANFSLGSIYSKRHEYSRALGYMEKARALNPGDSEVLFSLCDLYFKLKRDSDALAIEPELSEAAARRPGMHLRLGLMLMENERYSEALTHLEEAQQNGPPSFELFEALGTDYYNLNRYADAVQALSRARQINGEFPQTYFILAKAYAAQNDTRAIEAYQECVRLAPAREDAWEGLGRELAGQKESDKALEVFGGYAKSYPQNPLAHLLLGEAYFNKSQFLKALQEFQKAAALAPRLGRAFYSIGFTYQTMGKLSEAKGYLQRALALDPSLFLAAYQLGDILGAEGDYEESLRLLNKAIELNPDYAEAYLKMGEDYFRQKEYAEAEKYLKHAAQLQPDDAEAHFLLSRVYTASQRPALAETEYEEFRSLREKEAEKSQLSGLTYKK